ncbi:MAG: isoaspartyl peptidase/L-asparaginase, partial [bacterium]
MQPVIVSTWSWGRTACRRAAEVAAAGAPIADVVEEAVVAVELDPTALTVGYGGLPNEDGVVQTDALFMRGSTLDAGAVAALEGIRTPIRVARRVMERTHHVLLAGEGALRFAIEQGFSVEDMRTPAATARFGEWSASPEARARFRRALAGPTPPFTAQPRPLEPRPGHHPDHDTVCVVGTDGDECVVGVSTSGLGFKLPGRVGDSPLVGAGGFADAAIGAAAATGVGEEIMRAVASYAVVDHMRRGMHPMEAIGAVLADMVRRRGDALRARESQVGL